MTGREIIDKLNKIATAYCGFDKDIVFDRPVEDPNALCIVEDGPNYILYLYDSYYKKIIKSQTFKSGEAVLAAVERRIFMKSKLYPSTATSYRDNPQDDRRFVVYSQSSPELETGYRDHTYVWNYVCKDTLTGKFIRIRESINFSDYNCDYGYFYLNKCIESKDYIRLNVDYHAGEDNPVGLPPRPIATIGLPITINLLKQGIRNPEGQPIEKPL